MGTVDPAYIERLQEDIIIACHRLEQTGHESLVITVSEEGHLIFGSKKGKRYLEDKDIFIKDFVLHCQNSETVVKVEQEIDEEAEITEETEQNNRNSKSDKSLSFDKRDLTHGETVKDGTNTEKEKEDESAVLGNVDSADVDTQMFDEDTDDYDDTEALSPVEPKLETAADSMAADELAEEETMNIDGDYDIITVKEEQSENETEESPKSGSKQMSDAKVVLKRIKMIINSNQSTKLRDKKSKLKAQKMGKKLKGKDTGTMVHSAEKEFKCEICSKAFKRNEYLKKHMETHDPVKPFNCAQCGKSFMSQVALDNHERVHSGDKAIECKANMKSNYKIKVELRSSERHKSTAGQTEPERPCGLSTGSSTERSKQWRDKLKKNPQIYQAYLEVNKQRNKEYRRNLAEKQKENNREKTRLRLRRWRKKKREEKEKNPDSKPESKQKKKPRTSNQTVREYWRKKKREYREKITPQKKRRINEKRREQYKLKRAKKSTPIQGKIGTDKEFKVATKGYSTEEAI